MIIRISKRTPSSHITITNATHREKIFFYKKKTFLWKKNLRERERERERDRKKEKRFKMKAKMNL
jgi:hypothetical protein